jgi:thioredoxin reductase (NADPH)
VTCEAPDPQRPLASTAPSHAERLFPTLTSAQMARIAARGRRRPIARREVLVQFGDHDVPFFVVVSGEVAAARVGLTDDDINAVNQTLPLDD